MSNITITIDRDELLTRVANLGVAYAAISETGIDPEDQVIITNDLDEAFVDALLDSDDEPWIEGYIVVGPEPITRDTRRILFQTKSEAEGHLDSNTTRTNRHKYNIFALTRA